MKLKLRRFVVVFMVIYLNGICLGQDSNMWDTTLTKQDSQWISELIKQDSLVYSTYLDDLEQYDPNKEIEDERLYLSDGILVDQDTFNVKFIKFNNLIVEYYFTLDDDINYSFKRIKWKECLFSIENNHYLSKVMERSGPQAEMITVKGNAKSYLARRLLYEIAVCNSFFSGYFDRGERRSDLEVAIAKLDSIVWNHFEQISISPTDLSHAQVGTLYYIGTLDLRKGGGSADIDFIDLGDLEVTYYDVLFPKDFKDFKTILFEVELEKFYCHITYPFRVNSIRAEIADKNPISATKFADVEQKLLLQVDRFNSLYEGMKSKK